MQSDLFNCSVCFNQFDKTARKPKILPRCGHTICLFCLETILKENKPKCPLDRQVLETDLGVFVTNLVILQLIDERSKMTNEACPRHKEPKNLVCVDDKCRLCQYCVDHKGHEIKHINDLQKKANTRRRELELIINQITNEEKSVSESLEENRMRLLRANKEKFDALREFLSQKEEGLEIEIETFFMLEKLEFTQSFKECQSLKHDLRTKLPHLNNNEVNEKFFQALEDDGEKAEYNGGLDIQFLESIEDFSQKFNENLNSFHSKLIQIMMMDQFNEKIKTRAFDKIKRESFLKFEEKDERLVISPLMRRIEENLNQNTHGDSNLTTNKSKVTLNFKKTKLTEEMVQEICLLWEKIGKETTDLKIDLSLQSLTNEELVDYCSVFAWLGRNVSMFELALRDCPIDDFGLVKIINERLCLMKNLKGIKLHLPGTQISDETIEALSNCISLRKEKIEIFYLNASGRPITDTSIEKLCASFKSESKMMKSFGLVLNNTKIWDRSLESISQHILPLSNQWETFYLHFFGTTVSDNAVEQLLQNLKDKVKSLKSFIFEIGKTKATAKSIQFFVDNLLPYLNNNLERLQLGFGVLQLDEMTVKKLFKGLHPKVGESLKLFALSLDMNKVGDSNLDYLAKDLLCNFRNLENLLLTFSNCSLTDSSVKPLLTSLRPLAESLKQLTIRLNNNPGITDKSFERFNEDLVPLFSNLETFCVQVNNTKTSDTLKKILAQKEQILLSKQQLIN